MDDAPVVERLDQPRRAKRLSFALPSILGLDLTYVAGSAWGQGRAVTLFVAFTALTGFADSQGFVHASRVWDGGNLVVRTDGSFPAPIATSAPRTAGNANTQCQLTCSISAVDRLTLSGTLSF